MSLSLSLSQIYDHAKADTRKSCENIRGYPQVTCYHDVTNEGYSNHYRGMRRVSNATILSWPILSTIIPVCKITEVS